MPGPLNGLRIIDLSQHFSGPLGTSLLADQGAEVIKIEMPGGVDGLRHTHPQRNGVSAMFATVNRNKRALAVDLRTEAGRLIFRDLIKTADVVVQNFRPGVMDKLGCSYDELAAIKPEIILLSISGFGATGPYAERRAYEGIIQSIAGFGAAQADPSTGKPRLMQTAICDKLTALLAAQAITSALLARERSADGRGQHVELPMLDSAIWFLWADVFFNHILRAPGWAEAPRTTGFFKILDTTDGQVVILMMSQEEFVATCRALGCETLASDPRFSTIGERYLNLDAVNERLAPIVAAHSTTDLLHKLWAHDVPTAKVNTLETVLDDPQVIARGIIERWSHPIAGEMNQPGHPIKFGRYVACRRPAPAVGQDTDEILAALGYSDDGIEALRRQKVIA